MRQNFICHFHCIRGFCGILQFLGNVDYFHEERGSVDCKHLSGNLSDEQNHTMYNKLEKNVCLIFALHP